MEMVVAVQSGAHFLLVISGNMSDMADPRRRYNATVTNEMNVSIQRGIITDVLKIVTNSSPPRGGLRKIVIVLLR